jgi:hypothetical protein
MLPAQLMNPHFFGFTQMDWKTGEPGLREKCICLGSQTLRLLEMGPDYTHPGWCETGHIGFILTGSLKLKFPAETITVSAGNGFQVALGFVDRHRPIVAQAPVTMLLVEDHSPDSGSTQTFGAGTGSA